MTNSVKCHLFMKRTFAVRTFAVVWLGFIVIVNTVAVLGGAANHQQQQQLKQEARKLFGGYRITPKHCRPSNRVWRSNDNDTRPTAICMFNHECAQRGGEVVGACMDGFLFGACCQVPNTLDVEHTLINDAQNAHYHQHYQQKWQEQHYEIVHAENASSPDNNNNNHIQSANVDLEDAKFDLTSHTQNDMAGTYPSSPSIIQIHKDSVKISDTPTKAPFLQDDLVMQAINTLSTRIVQNRVSPFTTELPTKMNINSYSYQHQESDALTDTIKSPGETINQFYVQHNNQAPTDAGVSDLEYNLTFTKPNTTKATLSHYNESTFKDPYVLIHTLTNNDDTKKPFPATTISSITTHANAIETIIQQLNGSNQPGPSYTILEQQHTSTYNQMDGMTSTNSPIKLSALSSSEEEQTVPSSNYNDYSTLQNHETSEFNKMPSLGIAYPVDVSYIQEEDPVFIDNGVKGSSVILQQSSTDTNTFTDNINKEEQQQQVLEYQAMHNEKNEDLNHQTVTIIKVPLDQYSNETPKPLHSQTDASKIQALPTNNILSSINKNQGILESYAIDGSSQLDKEPYEVQQPVIIVKGPTNGLLSTNNMTKPLDNYATLITSQSYNPYPVLPNEVLVSSPTTLVQEALAGYTTIFPTPNKFKPTYEITKKPINPSTSTTTPASILITQLSENKKPFATITKVTKKPNHTNPLLLYGSHISTTTQQPSYEKPDKLTSTSYLTTAASTANINYHYNHVPPLIIANDKLDSLGLATDQMQQALERPSSSQETYQEPVYLNSVAPLKIQAAKPEQTVNLVKVPPTTETAYPPSPTVHITPKPTKQQILVQNTPASYKPLLNRIPAPGVVGMVGSNTNDFDDPGYYAAADNLKSTTEFAAPNDDKPAFPGYYGPTPIYPAFHVPSEKGDSAIEEETYTSPNDFVNFPPVRNPNLNMTGTLRPATNDFEPSTPTFIEDNVLKNKMNTLVSKIVESLQDNFEVLADMIDDASYVRPPSAYQTVAANSITTQKPIQKPTIKVTTIRPKTSTKKPPTRITTKSPIRKTTTTRKPSTSTKRVVVRPITSTTRKPNSRKPTKKVTTTTAAVPIEADENDTYAEEEEDPSANEVDGTHIGAGSRKFQCGMRLQLKSGRIVGGKGSTFGAYPWQVLVRESTWLGLFTKNKCGGVLITNRYVITAAHCQPGFLASLVAVMGEFDISGDTESKRAITKNVKRVIVHRNYDPATFENDIALLELDTPVHFDTHIIPICMPSDKADFTGRMATVTGWGRLKYGGGVPSVLQEVQVPIIENSVCQEMFHTAGHNKRILNSFLCAGYANGQKDSCEGDSGGPLVLKRPDGRYELAGTVSHGIKCAAPYLPGVYMRTTFYKPWLRTITGVK